MSLKDKIYPFLDEISKYVSAGRLYYEHLSTDYDPPFVNEIIKTPRFNYQYCSNVLLRLAVPAAIGTIVAGGDPLGGALLFGGSLLESEGEMVIGAYVWMRKTCRPDTEKKEGTAIQ